MRQKIHKNRNLLARWRKQHPLMLAMAITLGIVILLGSTFAWFTQADKVTNPLETQEQNFDFEIEEIFDPPGEVDPGEEIEKIVDVKNVGDVAGFTRVLILTEIISADGVLLPAIPGTTFELDLNITEDGGADGKIWADGGDGYYYYLGKLEPGETSSEHLFTSVTLADTVANGGTLGEEDIDAKMKIEVKVEAVELRKWKYREAWWMETLPVPSSDPAYNPVNDPYNPAYEPATDEWKVIDGKLKYILDNL